MTDLTLAPGCYGFALAFKESSPECSTCPFAARCKDVGAEQLARRRAELGIVVKEKRSFQIQPAKADASTAGPVLTARLPKKVEELLGRIERAGIKVTEALSRGENPFTTRPTFLRVACHLLLHMPQGIERKTLSTALQKKLNWSEGTAAAHTTQAFQVLQALGAAHESNGRLMMMTRT